MERKHGTATGSIASVQSFPSLSPASPPVSWLSPPGHQALYVFLQAL